MNERRARDVTWLEAFETARPLAPSWSDEDRAWADRVALEAVAPDAPADEFVAQRAGHALQRLGPREPVLQRLVAQRAWSNAWIGVVALVAFCAGLAIDSIGDGRRIDLLAPPFWGVLVWNLAVYLILIVWPLARLARRAPRTEGPIVRAMEALLRSRHRLPRASLGGSATALRGFAALWLARSRPLAALRAESVLHAGAAALALGLIAGLYARGLVLDYRAVWESTFLDADAARAAIATVFGPAARLTGTALPDAPAFAAMRVMPGAAVVGASAAPWIHLMAATLLGAVVLPRTLLALACAALAAARRRRFALPLDEAYFQRLLRLRKGGPARVSVHPYGSAPEPQATLALRAVLAAALGQRLDVTVAPMVGFGGEDDRPPAVDPACTHAIALFDLGATPEIENQGRFLRALRAAAPSGVPVVAVVDGAAFAKRFAGVGARVAERRDAWRAWGEALGTAPVVVDLDDGSGDSAARDLESALSSTAPSATPVR